MSACSTGRNPNCLTACCSCPDPSTALCCISASPSRFDAMLADGLIDEVKSLRQTLRSTPTCPPCARRLPAGVGLSGR